MWTGRTDCEHPELQAHSEGASGNGSITRLAPMPIAHADNASEQCRSACRYLATVLAALMQGEDRRVVLSPDWRPLQVLNDIRPLHPLIQEFAQGSFRQRQPPAIQGSGWVVNRRLRWRERRRGGGHRT